MDFIEFFRFGVNLYLGTSFPMELYIALAVGLIGYGLVYSFQAVALYTIGKKRGFGKVWMAFVPFFNTYYLGVVSEKNKIFNKKPKYFSLALAILEAVLVACWVLYYVSFYVLRGTGYITYEPYELITGSEIYAYTTILSGSTLPSTMAWMGWIVEYMYNILYYVQLVYIILNMFVLVSFFQTYAHGRYFIMALFSALAPTILFPIAGIIMFFVRKNTDMNYRDYMRMVQEQRYRQYQRNQQYGNPYNYNPYNGNPNNYNNSNPNNASYGNGSSSAADPFDDFKLNSNGDNGNGGSTADSGSDPFEDF